ncbi:hypothetical protein ACVSMD_10930, partial [Pseudomonas aeruginosa]
MTDHSSGAMAEGQPRHLSCARCGYCIKSAPPVAREPVVEDVIEKLRELNEPVPVPLELPEEELLVE